MRAVPVLAYRRFRARFDGNVARPETEQRLETPAFPRYIARAMAKRLQVNFHKPGPTLVAEDGQPRPCARGVGWVNEHTLQTLEKVGVPRTDAKGNVLPESVQRDKG